MDRLPPARPTLGVQPTTRACALDRESNPGPFSPQFNALPTEPPARLHHLLLGKIRSAVGSAQLLMSQKFQQFYWLCQQNLDPSAMPRPTSQDLAGYWDMLQLSVEDVSMKFDELQQLKLNNWKLMASPERKWQLSRRISWSRTIQRRR
ncbi:Disks large-associated protein 2 [Myotis brandtii]|uniref:Disks large-associated protein 2 n=1 Tax=Myotis brandtii TaxID=109478 RepID=S7Q098_MYOBR|nr:Disks large-associated protein 2 [Myotis brandtii]